MSEKDQEKLVVKIDGKKLPLNPFVYNIIRKTILAMLSSLKNTEIQYNEIVEVNVKRTTM